MRKIALLILIVNVSCSTSPTNYSLQSNEFQDCTEKAGFITGPFIHSVEMAQSIAELLISDRQSSEVQAKYYLEISDAGDYWVASQNLKGWPKISASDPNMITVIAGGGGLTMQIAKCDGTISNVHGLK